MIEDEEPDEGGDDEPINPLVDALFDEIEALRAQASLTLILEAKLSHFLLYSYMRQKCSVLSSRQKLARK